MRSIRCRAITNANGGVITMIPPHEAPNPHDFPHID
jgi:hypothetical protein